MDRMNFLSLTEPNLTDSMGQVNFFQQLDAEKCDYVVVIIIIIKNNNGPTIEIQRMWNVKTNVMPTGTISKSFIKYEGWNFNSGNYLFTTDTK